MKELILNNIEKATKNLKSNFLLLVSALALITLHLSSKELFIAQIVAFIIVAITFCRN